MYCPSCDKSYGAVHSRCPECHSWLKVSAPSSARKGAKTGSASTAGPAPTAAPDHGGVSTLDRDSSSSLGGDDGGWADPAPSSPSNWGDSSSGGEGWSTGDLGGGASAGSSASDGWGGSSAGSGASAGASAGSGWSGSESESSYGWGSEPSGSPTTPAPAAKKDSGWLDGGGSQDGWGGGSAGAAPASKPSGGGDGWLGGGGSESPSAGSSSSSGWLGGGDPEPSAGSSSGNGWLGDGGGAATAPRSEGGGGGGWLGDSADGGGAPSMTDMVDQAISVEESEDFVDDSWVDEEIRENDFDDLDIPEYAPPAPEVGGAFLKMLLVAVLVLLVGGGILFANNDKGDTEKTAADETVKRLEFGRATVKSGTVDLEAGKPGLAIPQFQEALVALSEGKAPQDEIYEAEVLLGRALMGDEDYKEAYKHWTSLKASGQEKYVAEADKGLKESSRQLRIQANGYLAEAKKYAAKDEIISVKRLGRDALDIYKEYDGSKAQLGDAHGVIGRGHYNGREYKDAQTEFKKAVALAPGAGYESYLSKVNNILAPKQYIPPMKTTPRRTNTQSSGSSKPSFSLGQPDYQRSSGRPSAGRRRTSSSSGSSGAPAPKAAPKKMKEIPAYRPSKSGSGGSRKGSKGVLKGY